MARSHLFGFPSFFRFLEHIQPDASAFSLFLDFGKHLPSRGERPAPVRAAHDRRTFGLHCFDKRFNFGQQGFAFRDFQRLGDDFRQLTGRRWRHYAAHRDLLVGVIQRVILVWLKDAQLAQPFAGDAAGSDIGGAAVGKFESRIGEVNFGRQDRDANGVQF